MTELLQLIAELERLARPQQEMDAETYLKAGRSQREGFYEELESEDE